MRLTNIIKRLAPTGLKDYVKHAVWAVASRHEAVHPPVLVFTSRRSGGTWLCETLARQPGVLFINEPTETGKYDRIAVRRGVFSPAILQQDGVPLDAHDLQWLLEHFDDLVAGRLKLRQPWNVWSDTFHARTDRVLIKTHVTKPFMLEIAEHFSDARILWQVRHPMPQAVSALKVGSAVTAPLYLRAAPLRDRLTSAQRELCETTVAHGDPARCVIVDWALENLVPFQSFAQTPRSLAVTYEAMVLSPETVTPMLLAHCGLEAQAGDRAGGRASASTWESSQARRIAQASAGDPKARRGLVDGWRSKASPELTAFCQQVLDAFEISLYRADESLPRPEATGIAADRFAH